MNGPFPAAQRTRHALFTAGLAILASSVTLAELPEGYWSEQAAAEVLNRTLEIELEPELGALSEA